MARGNNAVLNIELAGTNAGVTDGLSVRASNSVVRGLIINDFDKGGAGLRVAGGDNNKIEGNFIGTDPTGTSDVGNSFGVSILGTNNTLGGTSPEARNLISGNLKSGVHLEALTTRTKVLGNYIGTKRDGNTILANHFGSGVLIGEESTNNTIGNNTAAGANKIKFSGNDGVTIAGSTATGHRVLRNSFLFNEDLGIDLGDDGPTPNDPQDTDEGANTLQNKPLLTSATTTGTRITIQGFLRSTPNTNFTIRFFSNTFGNAGTGYLGLKSVSTDANGEVSFTRVLGVRVPAGKRITATATGPGGNTSEFSGVRVVV